MDVQTARLAVESFITKNSSEANLINIILKDTCISRNDPSAGKGSI